MFLGNRPLFHLALFPVFFVAMTATQDACANLQAMESESDTGYFESLNSDMSTGEPILIAQTSQQRTPRRTNRRRSNTRRTSPPKPPSPQAAPTPNTESPQVTSSAPSRRTRSRAPSRWASRTEVGLGYTLWNERLQIAQGGVTEDGYANHGGFQLNLERNWFRGHYQYGGSVALAMGQAGAGGFNIPFSDAGDRSWYAATVAPFAHYRLNPNIMVGLGAMVRYRGIDWTPIDPTIKLSARARLQYAGQIHFRWHLGRSYTFLQTYTPLGFEGESMWHWALQYRL